MSLVHINLATQRSSAADLAAELRTEDSRHPEQVPFPWAPAPPPRPPPTQSDRTAFVVGAALLLEELVADLDALIDDDRRTCRALNPVACDHEACAIVREYRAKSRAWQQRAQSVLTPSRNRNNG